MRQAEAAARRRAEEVRAEAMVVPKVEFDATHQVAVLAATYSTKDADATPAAPASEPSDELAGNAPFIKFSSGGSESSLFMEKNVPSARPHGDTGFTDIG